MSDPYRFSVSVGGAVVREDGKVLAIKRRDNGEWQIPGGLVEENETLLDAVRREVLEETGYDVSPEHVTGVYQHLRLNIVSIVFRCQLDGGSSTAGEESQEVAWLDRRQIHDRMTPAHACRLLDALTPEPASVRTHDGVALIT